MTRVSFILAALICVPRIAAADEPTEAEKLYDQGQVDFDARHFDDALAAWERSYELSKEPGLLFNIGQAYRQRLKHGDCAKAQDAYQRFVELDAASTQRRVAEGFIAEMRQCAARENQVPRSEPPPTAATSIAVPTSSIHQGRSKRIAGIVVAVSGVALAATGIYFGSQASSLSTEVTNACVGGCDWSKFSGKDADGRADERNQWFLYGAGGAAIVAGAVVYWLGDRERAQTVNVGVAPQSGGATLTWSGSW